MPELPKWLTDILSGTPIVAVVAAVVVPVVRWMDAKARQDKREQKEAADQPIADLKEAHQSELAERDRRIRALDREVRQLRRRK